MIRYKPPIIHPRREAPAFKRSCGESVCDLCKQPYRDHQRHYYTDDPDQDQYIIRLVETCDGKKHKL